MQTAYECKTALAQNIQIIADTCGFSRLLAFIRRKLVLRVRVSVLVLSRQFVSLALTI